MTERDWLTWNDPGKLEAAAGPREARARKFYLAACGCCRLVWWLTTFDASRALVEMVERYADGQLDAEPVRDAAERLHEAVHVASDGFDYRPDLLAASAAIDAARCELTGAVANATDAAATASYPAAGVEFVEVDRLMCDVLRDVFGNPFRPAALDPSWLTAEVAALARRMYDSHDFALMPVLADALRSAGCNSPDILNHCRDGGVHVRGCWVVDLILGRS